MANRRSLRLTLTLWSKLLTPAELRRITLIECRHFSLGWNLSCEGLPRNHRVKVSELGRPRYLQSHFRGTIIETSEPERIAPDTWKIVVTVETAEPVEALADVRLIDFAPDGPVCWARATLSRDAIRAADLFKSSIESVQVD